MKFLYNLLTQALLKPRYYVESVRIKGWSLILLSLIATLFMTTTSYKQLVPIISQLNQDSQHVQEYIPDFSYQEGELKLAEGNKSLYYSSPTFQLIIDSSIESQEDGRSIPISSQRKQLIEADKMFTLLLFKNNAYFITGGIINQIPIYQELFKNNQALVTALNVMANQTDLLKIYGFIMIFVTCFIIYWLQILILSSLIFIVFNRRLSKPMNFKQRIKIAVVTSFVPIILAQIVTWLIPSLHFGFVTIATTTIVILIYSFRSHTYFIVHLLTKMEDDEDDMYQKLVEDEKENSLYHQVSKDKDDQKKDTDSKK
ncbi:DUF1189 family protein [Hutsoniella sourekii]|uniref:DUF1189 family protein n=1 Tax=Hutsoniella sourekii TaxID=87650 RepID=UPI0004838857|nr:DUF1189 family protein [Hutsoniella sourekii]